MFSPFVRIARPSRAGRCWTIAPRNALRGVARLGKLQLFDLYSSHLVPSARLHHHHRTATTLPQNASSNISSTFRAAARLPVLSHPAAERASSIALRPQSISTIPRLISQCHPTSPRHVCLAQGPRQSISKAATWQQQLPLRLRQTGQPGTERTRREG